MIADQELVGVSATCTYTIPQSLRTSRIPVVHSGRYGNLVTSLEVSLSSSVVVNENNFFKL